MGLSSRRRTRVALWLLSALVALVAFDALRLWRQQRWNDLITLGPLPVAVSVVSGAPVEVRFALASAQAASGADTAALNHYRALQDDVRLGQAARYNSANLLLRQAITAQASAQPGQAIPLIELAKETYREVLRKEPAYWEARYNLERAQRLLPDPDESDAPPADAPSNAERAATTMRGYAPGLP